MVVVTTSPVGKRGINSHACSRARPYTYPMCMRLMSQRRASTIAEPVPGRYPTPYLPQYLLSLAATIHTPDYLADRPVRQLTLCSKKWATPTGSP